MFNISNLRTATMEELEELAARHPDEISETFLAVVVEEIYHRQATDME